MVNLREPLDILLHCHTDNLIDDEEFILLYDVTEQANPEFPYWTYPPFDLENFRTINVMQNLGFLRTIYIA